MQDVFVVKWLQRKVWHSDAIRKAFYNDIDGY